MNEPDGEHFGGVAVRQFCFAVFFAAAQSLLHVLPALPWAQAALHEWNAAWIDILQAWSHLASADDAMRPATKMAAAAVMNAFLLSIARPPDMAVWD